MSVQIKITGYVVLRDGTLKVFSDANKMRAEMAEQKNWRRAEWCDSMIIDEAQKTDRVDALEHRIALLEKNAQQSFPWGQIPLMAEPTMDASVMEPMQ